MCQKPLSPKPGALSYPFTTPPHLSFRWIGVKDAETQVLNSLTARRHQVMTMLVSEKNRLGTAIGAVSPRIEATSRGWNKS